MGGFQHFRCWFSALNSLKNQQRNHEFFWFFDILIDHIHSENQTNPTCSFLVFSISKPKNNKRPREHQKKHLLGQNQTFSQNCVFLVFGFARVLCFFWICLLISHDCHLCPYVCLPYRSWEVKLWPAFLTFSHPRACALCETKLGIGFAVMIMWW